MKLMIDLFSGLGGASEAFIQDPNYSVLRYDNNPAFENVPATTICDLRNYDIHVRHHISLIWSSPPCLEFSTAYNAPKSIAQRDGVEYEPNMELVERSLEIIKQLKPRYWIIENVNGSIPDFEKLGLKPRQIIGPFVLYGDFPLLTMDRDFQHLKADNDARHSEIRSNIRAKIPLEISQAVLNAVEYQKNISDYF
jgi:hypothetical protein